MQEGVFKDYGENETNIFINRINLVAANTRNNGGRVIFVQHDGTKEQGLHPFTPGWEILPALVKMETDVVVRKTMNDAFCRTDLNAIITNLNPEKLVITGWATDYCVDSTVRSAVSLGHNVVIISDGHTLGKRPDLTTKQIIDHYNWTWQNLLCRDSSIEVILSSEWCK